MNSSTWWSGTIKRHHPSSLSVTPLRYQPWSAGRLWKVKPLETNIYVNDILVAAAFKEHIIRLLSATIEAIFLICGLPDNVGRNGQPKVWKGGRAYFFFFVHCLCGHLRMLVESMMIALTKRQILFLAAFFLGPLASPKSWANSGGMLLLCFSNVLASSHAEPVSYMCFRMVSLSSSWTCIQLVKWMFTSLTELMGKGAFIPMGVEIVANSSAVLELGAIRESLVRGSSLPSVEKPHLEAPIWKFLPRLLSTWVVATVQLVPSAFVGGGTDLVSTSFDGFGSAGFVGKTCLGSFYKETLCKRWDDLGDGIFVDVFKHF